MSHPIYVINLDYAAARLAHARSELDAQGLTFERVRAVEASEVRNQRVPLTVDSSVFTYYVPLKDAEIACVLSHRVVWQRFLESNDTSFAVILEDDFALQGDLVSIIQAVAASPYRNWDVIKLWAKPGRHARVVASLATRHDLIQERVASIRTVGQIVSRAGARKLLEGTLPIRRPIDVQMQHWWELDIRLLAIRPSVVRDVGDALPGGSSIRTGQYEAPADKVRREVGRIIFRAGLRLRSEYHFAMTR